MSFTIGCDPELICRLNCQFVTAGDYFKNIFSVQRPVVSSQRSVISKDHSAKSKQ